MQRDWSSKGGSREVKLGQAGEACEEPEARRDSEARTWRDWGMQDAEQTQLDQAVKRARAGTGAGNGRNG